MTILITGASGFIGSFIVEEALRQGHDVWAAVRSTSPLRYLQDRRVRLLELDFSSSERMASQMREVRPLLPEGRWDYVVHAAGATKCLHPKEFFQVNQTGTKNFVWALLREEMVPHRFVFVSSLSIFGAIREKEVPYTPIQLTDTPRPNTAYGQSKLKAEQFLMYMHQFHHFPVVILRPTGVYGPREQDYMLMAKSIGQHVDFSVGFRPQEITFIYVRDVVSAIFLALKAPDVEGKAYFLSDGEVYSSRHFSDLLQECLGVSWVLHFRAPLWLLRLICTLSGTLSRWRGKPSTLNMDKYHILSQRNWQCDIEPTRRDLGFTPQWPLERGVREMVEWYKECIIKSKTDRYDK